MDMNLPGDGSPAAASRSEGRAQIERVRIPWYRWQTPALELAAIAIMLCWFFAPQLSQPGNKYLNTAFAAVLLSLGFMNQYLREKAWRRLIESEAPALSREIDDPGSAMREGR